MRCVFFFSSRRRHTRCSRDWSSDVCSSDLDSNPLVSIVLPCRNEQGYIQACLQSALNQDPPRSEEHTSELQSRLHLVCRLLLEKKKNKRTPARTVYF